MEYLITRSGIESNKAFQRLLDKTQVLSPEFGRKEIVKNRLTHSYEVATSAEIIAHAISTDVYDADYKKAVFNVSLLHDVGHPPFGHHGAMILDGYFKSLGLEDGFSDNNNNLVIIEKNQIKLSDYEVASLIKYPEKLYSDQKGYLELLNKMIDDDIAYFKDKIEINKKPKRTLACQIMDYADANTYVCADLTDCFALGLTDEKIFVDLLAEDKFSNVKIITFLTTAVQAIQSKNKTLLKKAFGDLKICFNQNYYLGKNLQLYPRDLEISEFNEILQDLSMKYYIHSEYVNSIRDDESSWLKFYIDYVIKEEFYPSRYYRKQILNSVTELEKITHIRDMIAASTDSFIKNFFFEKNN
jgi:predicted deoxyguanosinetriphosphate triphosphohydrolase